MLALTRKTDYALVALATLASFHPDGLSARALAERAHLPLPALRNILKKLGCYRLLASEQGPQGGYRLARPAGEITVAEVVETIEGPVRFAPCCPVPAGLEPGHDITCPLEDSCLIKGAIRGLHDRLHDFLRQTTIADLVELGQRNAARRSAATQPQRRADGRSGDDAENAAASIPSKEINLIGHRG